MTIDIPIHPISYKILLIENDNQNPHPNSKHPYPVIRISSRSILFDHLRFRYGASREKLKRIKGKLTARITIDSRAKIRHPHQVGYYLFRIHKDQIFKFVHAQVLGGHQAASALKMFCSIYQIDDDDIDLDSLAREWRRYKSQKLDQFESNFPNFNQRNRKPYLDGAKPLIPLSKSEIESLVSNCVKQNIDCFITAQNTFDKSLLHQALTFSYYHLGSYLQREIAEIEKIDVSTVSYRIQQFENVLETNASMSETYQSGVKLRL